MVETNQLHDALMADLVFNNGKIVTVDSRFSIAQAVAVKYGRIVAVGDNDDINALTGKKTRIINLNGATMMPGINDSHCHISDWALTRPPLQLEIRYPVVKSIKDIIKMVTDKASTLKPGEWIIGEGWDEGYLEECLADPDRKPSLEDLDRVAPDNPVVLTEYSGHRAWVNSLALKTAGIIDNTPDPAGGRIGKTKAGKPDGLLYEKASINLRGLVLPPTYTQRKNAITGAMAELNSLGITSFTDAGVDREKWACYSDVFNETRKQGKWTCRVNMLLMMGGFGKLTIDILKDAFTYVGARYNFGNDWLKIAGTKMIGDGIPPLKTACMHKPYLDGTYGFLVTEGENPEEQEKNLRELIRISHGNRMQIGIHSCGERTIDVITDQYMKCIEEDPWDARHYIIHSDFTLPETIRKVSKFNSESDYKIAFNVQSPIKWTISDHMQTVVGPERAAYQWPLRSMLDAGLHVGNSSDAPVIYPDWRPGVQGAVLRESKATGKASGPEQCITVEEAVATYTIHNAWLDHKEDVKGSVEAGKLADFCVVDNDILTINPHRIVDLKILMTVAGGEIVYDSGDL
jgi:predicted amidohydrolase YtcJ